jgi:hypothetical protein
MYTDQRNVTNKNLLFSISLVLKAPDCGKVLYKNRTWLEGVIIFLSCGGGNYLLDYLLITLITRFLSPSGANFLLKFLNVGVS